MKEPEKTENMFWIHIKKCLCECEYVYTFFNLNTSTPLNYTNNESNVFYKNNRSYIPIKTTEPVDQDRIQMHIDLPFDPPDNIENKTEEDSENHEQVMLCEQAILHEPDSKYDENSDSDSINVTLKSSSSDFEFTTSDEESDEDIIIIYDTDIPC